MRLKPLYDGYTVKLPNGDGSLEEIGGLEYSASVVRLVCLGSFVYEAEGGRISAELRHRPD